MKKKINGFINLDENQSQIAKPEIFKYGLKTSSYTIFSEKKFTEIGKYNILIRGNILDIFETENKNSRINEDVIIKLFEKYGSEFPRFLDGLFHIIIIDKKKNYIGFFNSRYEINNVYYYLTDDNFIFSDSLRGLKKIITEKLEFNTKSISTFIANGFSSSEKTQFKHISRQLPTESIIFQNNKIKFENTWKKEFSFNRKKIKNVTKNLNTYETLFRKSILNFIKAKKPKELGCLLSGGQDTSYVFINASKIFKKPIHTFTASFEGWGFDESPKAKSITKMFGGIHHKILIGPEALDYFPELIRTTEEPVAGSTLPVHICAKEASKYVDTLLTGDTGDTLWGEYYPVAEWHKYLKNTPLFLRKNLYFMTKQFRKTFDWERLWEMEHVFDLFKDKHFYKDFFMKLCTYRHFDSHARKKLLQFKSIKQTNINEEFNTCKIKLQFSKNNFSDMLIEAKMLYGVYMYMNPPTQKSIEAHNINFFSPYLNHSLMKFINKLPTEWLNAGSSFKKLINDAEKRKFHKLALLKHLPKRYVYSLQQSFDVPWHALYNKRPLILANLLKRLKKRGWYKEKELEKIFNEFKKQKPKPYELNELKNHGYRITTLLSLEIWCMEFLNNKSNVKATIDSSKPIPLEKYLEV